MSEPVPYGNQENQDIERDWQVDVAVTPTRYLITYTCPLCHTVWSTNLELGQDTCELYCNIDGNKAMYTLPPSV